MACRVCKSNSLPYAEVTRHERPVCTGCAGTVDDLAWLVEWVEREITERLIPHDELKAIMGSARRRRQTRKNKAGGFW